MTKLYYSFLFNFIEGPGGDVPVPTPGGGGGQEAVDPITTAQTGDMLALIIAILIGLIVLSVIGFTIFKKYNVKSSNSGVTAISKMSIAIVAAFVFLICTVTLSFTTIRALAQDNHIYPDFKQFSTSVTSKVNPTTGEITTDEAVFNPILPSEVNNQKFIIDLSVLMPGHGFEGLSARLKVYVNNLVAFDSYVGCSELSLIEINVGDKLKFEITEVDPEVAKSLINQNEVFGLVFGFVVPPSESVQKITVQFPTYGLTITDKGKQILTENGWIPNVGEFYTIYEKEYDMYTETSQLVSFFEPLMNTEIFNANDNTNVFTGLVSNEYGFLYRYITDFTDTETRTFQVWSMWAPADLTSMRVKIYLNILGNFTLTQKGVQVAQEQGWTYDEMEGSVYKDGFALHDNLHNALKVWTPDCFECADGNYAFNYFTVDEMYGLINGMDLVNNPGNDDVPSAYAYIYPYEVTDQSASITDQNANTVQQNTQEVVQPADNNVVQNQEDEINTNNEEPNVIHDFVEGIENIFYTFLFML